MSRLPLLLRERGYPRRAFTPASERLDGYTNLAGVRRKMTFTAIDPRSGIAKDYNNSAEWFKEVEEFTAREPEKPREVKTYRDASQRLREEIGLDLRSPAEQKAAADNEIIEKRIAEGVSAALAKVQQAETTTQSPAAHEFRMKPQKVVWNFAPTPKCSCKTTSQKSAAVQVSHARGPTMDAHALSADEARAWLKQAGPKL